MKAAVIFDIDGTLIDSNGAHAESFSRVFDKYGKQIPPDELKWLMGMGADKIMKIYLSDEQIDAFGDDLKMNRRRMFLDEYLPKVKTVPRLRELFERLKADNKQIVLASSASDQEIEQYKKLMNISDLIEEETSSDDAGKSKPDPDIFEAAFEKLRAVDKDAAVIIGDTPYDAEAAQKVGIEIYGVESGGWSREKLSGAGCKRVFRDIGEIYDRYAELF